MIRYVNVLIQRDGRLWLMPERVLMGVVVRERREWRSKCERCRPWHSPISRTRRDAVRHMIDHWNDDESEGKA